MNEPSIMKIAFQQLLFYPTTASGVYSTSKVEGDNNCTRSSMQIFKFYIALNFVDYKTHRHKKQSEPELSNRNNNLSAEGESVSTPRPEKKETTAKDYYWSDSNIDSEYKYLRQHDSYFVFPIDLLMQVQINNDLKADLTTTPRVDCQLQLLDPVTFLISAETTKYIASLLNQAKIMKIIQRNLHLRPLVSPMHNHLGWWKYAIQAVFDEQKRTQSYSQVSTSRLLKIKDYLKLYKRYQNLVGI